jgi:hypothetical protein
MQWTIENMWAFHIQPEGTPFGNSYQMEYHLVQLRMSITSRIHKYAYIGGLNLTQGNPSIWVTLITI